MEQNKTPPNIVFCTSTLHIQIDLASLDKILIQNEVSIEIAEDETHQELPVVPGAPETTNTITESSSGGNQSPQINNDDENPFDDLADGLLELDIIREDDNVNVDGIRSRVKSDVWHEYHSIPMGKTVPVKSLVITLIIHATFEFVNDDLAVIVAYLQNNLGINDWLWHFWFNREWWRKRVRMLTPKAEEHAARIRVVSEFFRTNTDLQPYYTEDIHSYFRKLEQKALSGFYEELSDVSLFKKTGVDSKGFTLWLRNRGSVRCELVHQKMYTSIGPWGVGPKTAHFLLLQLSYRFNVNTGIKRLGNHDFGHKQLYLIDRIQN